MQICEAFTGGHLLGLPDQPGADAASPTLGLDKEALDLGSAVIPRQDDYEADDPAATLGDMDTLLPDMFRGKLDGLRMGEQGITVRIPGK